MLTWQSLWEYEMQHSMPSAPESGWKPSAGHRAFPASFLMNSSWSQREGNMDPLIFHPILFSNLVQSYLWLQNYWRTVLVSETLNKLCYIFIVPGYYPIIYFPVMKTVKVPVPTSLSNALFCSCLMWSVHPIYTLFKWTCFNTILIVSNALN